MTLPKWLTSARDAVDQAISTESRKERHERAVEALTALDDNLDDLLALATAVQAGREAGWLDAAVPDNYGAGQAVAALQAKGPQRREVNGVQTSLPRFVVQARGTVMAAWKAWVRSQVGGIEDLQFLTAVLGRIDGHERQRDLLEQASQPIQELMDSLPAADSGRNLASAAEVVDAAFTSAFGDVEVREFLVAAARSGALLEQLTPAVTAWIQENGAADLMRVSIGPVA